MLIIVKNVQITINQRIELLIKSISNDNQAIFAGKIGVRPTVINNIVGGRMSEPSFQTLLKIKVAFPQISSDWLLLGEGEMLKETIKSNDNSSNLIQGDKTKKNNLAIADRRSKAIAGDSGVGSFENDPLKEKILQMQEVIDELRSDKKQLQSQIEYLQREKK